MTVTLDEMRDYFEYLDKVRNGGDINMFGARRYLILEFGLDKNVAGRILSAWMGTFRVRSDAGEVITDEKIHVRTIQDIPW